MIYNECLEIDEVIKIKLDNCNLDYWQKEYKKSNYLGLDRYALRL